MFREAKPCGDTAERAQAVCTPAPTPPPPPPIPSPGLLPAPVSGGAGNGPWASSPSWHQSPWGGRAETIPRQRRFSLHPTARARLLWAVFLAPPAKPFQSLAPFRQAPFLREKVSPAMKPPPHSPRQKKKVDFPRPSAAPRSANAGSCAADSRAAACASLSRARLWLAMRTPAHSSACASQPGRLASRGAGRWLLA